MNNPLSVKWFLWNLLVAVCFFMVGVTLGGATHTCPIPEPVDHEPSLLDCNFHSDEVMIIRQLVDHNNELWVDIKVLSDALDDCQNEGKLPPLGGG